MRNVLTRGRVSVSVPTVNIEAVEPAPADTAAQTLSVNVNPAAPNRHARRKNRAFSLRLARRLRADGTPVTVETLPDGGLDIRIDTRNAK